MTKPKPPLHQRPPTIGKPQREWPLEGGSEVVCAGPGKQHARPRGQMCRKCEWRAFEEAS